MEWTLVRIEAQWQLEANHILTTTVQTSLKRFFPGPISTIRRAQLVLPIPGGPDGFINSPIVIK